MDEIARAYAVLSSIKANTPNTFAVDQSWANDFHFALDKVEKSTGQNLQEFRIPHADMYRETSGGNYLSGETHYSGRTVIERTRFMLKLDAVLNYFTFEKDRPTKGQIGFSKSA
jgi:hypothetical protein